MKMTASFAAACFAALFFFVGCHPHHDVTLSPFAQSLRNTCTTPFVGRGDSINIYLPTAFTPNGDGINDFYGLTQGNYSFSSFLLSIYDTTGVLVFKSTTGTRLMWDGTDMNTNRLSTKYKFYVKINYTTTGNITDSGSTYVFLLSSDSARSCVRAMPADTAKYEFPDQFLPGTGFVPHSSSSEIYCN